MAHFSKLMNDIPLYGSEHNRLTIHLLEVIFSVPVFGDYE